GRWRLYAIADPAAPSADGSALRRWADRMLTAPDSPVAVHIPHGADLDALFDIKVIYQRGHHGTEVTDTPKVFRSRSGPFRLADDERGYATDRRDPAFFDPVGIVATRGISRDGAVMVRPDQHLAGAFPLTDTAGLAEFFRGHLRPAEASPASATAAAVSWPSADHEPRRRIMSEKREQELLAKVPQELFIDGRWRAAEGGETLEVRDPATGEVIRTIASASSADAQAAIDAAADAFPAWSRTPARERGELLRRAFDLLTERAE